jgi:hypothetical protein
MQYPSQRLEQTLDGPKSTGNREEAAWALFRNIVKLKMEDSNLKIQWATAIECMINTEDQPNLMKDTQILAQSWT